MLKIQTFSARNYFDITASLSSETPTFVVYFQNVHDTCISNKRLYKYAFMKQNWFNFFFIFYELLSREYFLRLYINFATLYFCCSAMNSGKLLSGDLKYMTLIPPYTHFGPESVSQIYGDTALPKSLLEQFCLSFIPKPVEKPRLALA